MVNDCPFVIEVELDLTVKQRTSDLEKVMIDETKGGENSDVIVEGVRRNRFQDVREEFGRQGVEGGRELGIGRRTRRRRGG